MAGRRADHGTANAGCALIVRYPAGLLKASGVSVGAISSGKARGREIIVAWTNEWGYRPEPGEDLRADRARAVLLLLWNGRVNTTAPLRHP